MLNGKKKKSMHFPKLLLNIKKVNELCYLCNVYWFVKYKSGFLLLFYRWTMREQQTLLYPVKRTSPPLTSGRKNRWKWRRRKVRDRIKHGTRTRARVHERMRICLMGFFCINAHSLLYSTELSIHILCIII